MGLTQNELDAIASAGSQPKKGDSLEALVAKLSKGLPIPTSKEMVITYAGATNNISTVVYKDEADGTTLATLTLTYAAGGAANDDLVTKATLS